MSTYRTVKRKASGFGLATVLWTVVRPVERFAFAPAVLLVPTGRSTTSAGIKVMVSGSSTPDGQHP